MALVYCANPIVTDGMVFYYDQKNSKTGDTKELINNRTATTQTTNTREFGTDSLFQRCHGLSTSGTAGAAGTGFSMSAWIIRTGSGTTGWDSIIRIYGGSEPLYRMMWFGWMQNTTDQFHCSFPYKNSTNVSTYWDVNPTFANAGMTLSLNTWYNFSLSYNNSTRVLNTYIDANFALSGTRPNVGNDALNWPGNTGPRLYGTSGNTYIKGQIDSVVMYDRPLSAAEVQQNFDNRKHLYK